VKNTTQRWELEGTVHTQRMVAETGRLKLDGRGGEAVSTETDVGAA